jgi:hypothetical protein
VRRRFECQTATSSLRAIAKRSITVIASEAKQSIKPQRRMDCFVASLLAMTLQTQARVLATRCARGLRNDVPRKNKRAQGKPGAQCTRSLACESKKHTSVITTGSPNWSGLPCANGFDGLYVLSPVNGLFCHRRLRNCFRRLDSSVAAPGPHDFAVRFSATRQRHLRVHRIPPHVRDDAYAPLVEAGCANSTIVSDFRKEIFWRQDWKSKSA